MKINESTPILDFNLTTLLWRKVGSHRFLRKVGSLEAAVVPLAVSFTISLKP